MRIRIPPKKICEKFHLTYELKGAEKAVKVLTEYYGIRRMKIIANGRRVMRACEADYFEGIACFTRKGLNKRNVLHELYHHIVENKGLEMSYEKEEREANRFVREVCMHACVPRNYFIWRLYLRSLVQNSMAFSTNDSHGHGLHQ